MNLEPDFTSEAVAEIGICVSAFEEQITEAASDIATRAGRGLVTPDDVREAFYRCRPVRQLPPGVRLSASGDGFVFEAPPAG